MLTGALRKGLQAASTNTIITRGVSQDTLLKFLENLQQYNTPKPTLGIGLDSCVLEVPNTNLNMVQTTDFFYPIIDHPYIMGKITCANVLSDLYAMGVTDCLNMLMLLGVPKDMTAQERDTVVPMIMAGFRDLATEAGVGINGGQTVLNPWMTIGGVATAVLPKEKIIMPTGAKEGDVLLLTKPLGVQMAIAAQQKIDDVEALEKMLQVISMAEIEESFEKAVTNMSTLNLKGAHLMHKYNAHACTDVTGFGILGHARNLAEMQQEKVHLRIEALPILKGMHSLAKLMGNPHSKLLIGTAPETSGGLLVVLAQNDAEGFMKEMGGQCWKVGSVIAGDKTASVADNVEIIEV